MKLLAFEGGRKFFAAKQGTVPRKQKLSGAIFVWGGVAKKRRL